MVVLPIPGIMVALVGISSIARSIVRAGIGCVNIVPVAVVLVVRMIDSLTLYPESAVVHLLVILLFL